MTENLLTKEQFESLNSDMITRKEYDRIMSLISLRCGDIVLKMLTSKNSRFWWDFDNCNYDSKVSGGYFDTEAYKENIGIGGEYVKFPAPYDDLSFPTRWLWEKDWYEEFKNEVAKYEKQEKERKEKEQAKQENRKQEKEQLIAQALSKLNEEERKALGY